MNHVYAARGTDMPLQRPWLPDPAHPGFYAPLAPDVAFPATRGDMAALNRAEARRLAHQLGVANSATMTKVDALNAAARAIGFLDRIV